MTYPDNALTTILAYDIGQVGEGAVIWTRLEIPSQLVTSDDTQHLQILSQYDPYARYPSTGPEYEMYRRARIWADHRLPSWAKYQSSQQTTHALGSCYVISAAFMNTRAAEC